MPKPPYTGRIHFESFKRKVVHSHVSPLLIFHVILPCLSKNFLCHQLIKQACLHYATSNTTPGITLPLHYQTTVKLSFLIIWKGEGKKLLWKHKGQVHTDVKMATRNMFLKPVGLGCLSEARSSRSTGPSVFRPRKGQELLLQGTLEKAAIVWSVEEWIRSQSSDQQKLSRIGLEWFHNFVLKETKLLTKSVCSRD